MNSCELVNENKRRTAWEDVRQINGWGWNKTNESGEIKYKWKTTKLLSKNQSKSTKLKTNENKMKAKLNNCNMK